MAILVLRFRRGFQAPSARFPRITTAVRAYQSSEPGTLAEVALDLLSFIGRHTGATLMVARAGCHPIAELEQSVKRLNQAGVQVKGFVFNDLDTDRQRYRYGYKGYVYKYSYSGKS